MAVAMFCSFVFGTVSPIPKGSLPLETVRGQRGREGKEVFVICVGEEFFSCESNGILF